MTATLPAFRLGARSCTCKELVYQYGTKPMGKRRHLSSSTSRCAAVPIKTTSHAPRANFKDPLRAIKEGNKSIVKLLESVPWNSGVEVKNEEADTDLAGIGITAPMMEKQKKKKPKDTFLNMGDPEPWEEDGQLEDDHDDITTLGHGELERHREMRHYARLAAWEMPLLANMAKPFEPPSKDMPLRFRYTSYLGENHPAENKVVLEFSPADMPSLTGVQREKLKKLAGVRYNPEKDIVKMSCESFETQAQNKRYLGDLVDNLLHESRTGDSFEDVPLDLRHHRVKSKPKFPREWALTEERKAELIWLRLAAERKDEAKALGGSLVDGLKQIEEGIAKASLVKVAPELVIVGKGKNKVTVRR